VRPYDQAASLPPAGEPAPPEVPDDAAAQGEAGNASTGGLSRDPQLTHEPTQGGSDTGAAFEELTTRLAKVEVQLAEFHHRSAHRESVIDRLHEQNQRLRSGIGRIILEPVVADLIRLYDQLDREVRRLEAGGADRKLLGSFADDVAQILDRCGIEVFSAEPGDPFEHGRHRPLAVVACGDASRHNTVAEVVTVGFAERESRRIRRPVQARFYQYSPGGGESTQGSDAAQP
jgi:molecular chaperone GrpE